MSERAKRKWERRSAAFRESALERMKRGETVRAPGGDWTGGSPLRLGAPAGHRALCESGTEQRTLYLSIFNGGIDSRRSR